MRVDSARTLWLVRAAAVLAAVAAVAALAVAPRPTAWFVALCIAAVALAVFAFVASFVLGPGRAASGVSDRLRSVLAAIDTAVLVSHAEGRVQTGNERFYRLFDLEPHSFDAQSYPELLRTVARRLEDPEGFMELYQPVLADATRELERRIEQIIPERRHLVVKSRPARDATGDVVGRIDVFTDVSEASRRAAEVEVLLDRARRTADSYQRGLLPQTVPSLPRVGLVAHYVSAAGERAVCGDFYDFLTLADGRVGLVIGDVVGSGPPAANDAAMTRYSLRSIATQASDVGELLERLNRHVGSNLTAERFVRLVICVLDPERATLEYANAGHVPPILYRSKSGAVEWQAEGGIALGIEPDVDFKTAATELQPGDTLVMYTDGVTEAPRNGRPFGQGKFSDLIKEYGVGSAGELVQAIRRAVAAWVPEGQIRDDIAMVVCEVVPDETIAEPTRELVVPNDSARLGDIRSFVAQFLADLRAPVEMSQEVLIAAGEAAANATRHGRRAEMYSEIRVQCSLEGRNVLVTVVDEGAGVLDAVPPPPEQPPDKFASGGRGLFLMRRLMDGVDITTGEDGTTVTMARRMFDSPPPGAPPERPNRPDPPAPSAS